MKNLKKHLLLLVDSIHYQQDFNHVFKEIHSIKNNASLMRAYKDIRPSIIFLNCYDETVNTIEIIKEIRKIDKHTIIVIFTHTIDKKDLIKALPLQIFDCIENPIDTNKVNDLLMRLNSAMTLSMTNCEECMQLKDGYNYCSSIHKLYDVDNEEISLTAKEACFLDLLVSAKGNYVSIENIEYCIWEEDSLNNDCTGRLKTLLNGLRKKLPDNCIDNEYGVGYRLVSNELSYSV